MSYDKHSYHITAYAAIHLMHERITDHLNIGMHSYCILFIKKSDNINPRA